jgi:transposase InsO family protein
VNPVSLGNWAFTDNACVESFFHSMKVEAIQYKPIMIRDEMRQTVFEYIEADYNRTRRHSALGYLSPVNNEVSSPDGADQIPRIQ